MQRIDIGGLGRSGSAGHREPFRAVTAGRFFERSGDGAEPARFDFDPTRLGPGDAAAFKAGATDGHRAVDRSARPALLREIGSQGTDERTHHPDNDPAMARTAGKSRFTRKDGTPYA
ncbi:MAG: hypothetical protein GC150_01870 [Rhizobiales bacterium]|nr:hypothetical protein [Hyphomicrobiales bacterium]